MYGIIYLLTNKINFKKYVGQTKQTVEERFKEHKWCKKSHIGRAIRKYGAENFLIEILEECETAEQLNEREIYFIAYFNCKFPNGYNHTDGGEDNWERNPESIAKMSRKGKKQSEETKAYLARLFKGRPGKPHTAESKAKLSAAAKNKREVICVETGVTYESISEAARCNNVGVQSVHGACKNPNRTAGGYHWQYVNPTEEEIQAVTKSQKPSTAGVGITCRRAVKCIETGVVYESISEAARAQNIERLCISRACKDPSKICRGCHWCYVDERPAEATKGHPCSDAVKSKLSANCTTKKPVVCVEAGKIYDSTTEAAHCHNVRLSNIVRACKEPTRTAAGYHWQYLL